MYTDEQKILTARRLKELRQGKKLSHEKLQLELLSFGFKISLQSIKDYEVDNPFHSKFRATAGMKIETLANLADFYNVSVDYLLGKNDNPTVNAELSAVCKYLKLPQDTVQNIEKMSDTTKEMLSSIINADNNKFNKLMLESYMMSLFVATKNVFDKEDREYQKLKKPISSKASIVYSKNLRNEYLLQQFKIEKLSKEIIEMAVEDFANKSTSIEWGEGFAINLKKQFFNDWLKNKVDYSFEEWAEMVGD